MNEQMNERTNEHSFPYDTNNNRTKKAKPNGCDIKILLDLFAIKD